MRILALSDRRDALIDSSALKKNFSDVDLIAGCGDLPASYLEYVVSVLNVPLVYVPGNHDSDMYHVPGGINLDGRVVHLNGMTLAGLGGSIRYKPHGRHQYTQTEMRWRTVGLLRRVIAKPICWRRGVDVFLTHSPMYGVHDGPDGPHTGFHAFHSFVRFARVHCMLHGHVHVIRNLVATHTETQGMDIINVFPQRVLEYDLMEQQVVHSRMHRTTEAQE